MLNTIIIYIKKCKESSATCFYIISGYLYLRFIKISLYRNNQYEITVPIKPIPLKTQKPINNRSTNSKELYYREKYYKNDTNKHRNNKNKLSKR
jgi:hypothetical protein